MEFLKKPISKQIFKNVNAQQWVNTYMSDGMNIQDWIFFAVTKLYFSIILNDIKNARAIIVNW